MNAETLQQVHWLSALPGGLAFFILGSIWYSKLLFSKQWLLLAKIDINQPDAKKGIAIMFIGSFILMIIVSMAIAILAYKMQTIGWMNGAKLGLITGCCIGCPAIGINYFYEKKPLGLFFINGGYFLLGNMLSGAIIGAMA